MLKGYNSDITYAGRNYHLQTEDWGTDNPFLVSQIFFKGAVVKTIKIPYTKVLPDGIDPDIEAIGIALEAQHSSILDLLLSGQLFDI